jgi:hypothetical protein
MGAWETFALVLFIFPPTAIVFVAFLVKLFAVLEEMEISWGKSFGIATIVNIALLFGWIIYANY